jgi:hypothetical protein
MLIIPEPFFVHSGLTSLVQLADIIAYVVSWGVRLPHMTEPGRPELAELAKHVLRLQVATARRLLRNSPLTTARQSLQGLFRSICTPWPRPLFFPRKTRTF